jgi:ATP-dependent helicase Lhr and Lhr-like helicase
VAPATLTGIQDSAATILLGGRSWRVANIDWPKRIAWVQPSNEHGKSTWPGSSKLMHYQLCRAIEAELVNRGTGIAFSNRARSQYEQLCEEFAFCDGNIIPAVFNGRQRARLWTFAGNAVNGPLSQALANKGLGVDTFDNFSVTLSRDTLGITSDILQNLNMSERYSTISVSLERALKFSTCLPPGEATAILSERLRDESGLRETLARPVRGIVEVK